MVVAIKPKRSAVLLVAGPVTTVDQQDVLPAVAVVMKKGAALSECLRQELPAECATVVLELNSGGLSNVGEVKSQGP